MISVILILIMTVSTAAQSGISVFAAQTVWDGSVAAGFDSGIGTDTDPFVIKTAEQLAFLAESVNNGISYSGKYLRLDSDIILNDHTDWESWGDYDQSGRLISPVNNWTPIGKNDDNHSFKGYFDGNGHTVMGLFSNQNGYGGLFGYVTSGAIRDLNIDKSCVIVRGLSQNSFAGGIAGCLDGDLSVSRCAYTGNITGSGFTGGLAGYVRRSAVIRNCSSTGSVSGGTYTGGIAGYTDGDCSIEYCYHAGMITGSESNTGGIVGRTSDGASVNIKHNYYLSGCVSNGNGSGTALTDAQMRNADSFEGWNFNSCWEILYNEKEKRNDYPTLRCFGSKTYNFSVKFYNGNDLVSEETVPENGTIVFEEPGSTGDLDFGYWEKNGVRYYGGENYAQYLFRRLEGKKGRCVGRTGNRTFALSDHIRRRACGTCISGQQRHDQERLVFSSDGQYRSE